MSLGSRFTVMATIGPRWGRGPSLGLGSPWVDLHRRNFSPTQGTPRPDVRGYLMRPILCLNAMAWVTVGSFPANVRSTQSHS